MQPDYNNNQALGDASDDGALLALNAQPRFQVKHCKRAYRNALTSKAAVVYN